MRAVALGLWLVWSPEDPFHLMTRRPGKLGLSEDTDADQLFLQTFSLLLSCLSAIDDREIPAQLLRAEGTRVPRSANGGP